MRPHASALGTIAALVVVGQVRAQGMDCHRLTGKTFADAVVVTTEEVGAPVSVTSLAAGERAVSVTAPVCRIHGLVRPTEDSQINLELWLPAAGSWNGKYQGVGNGGFIGAMMYEAMERALRAGYAVSSTDTGHSSTLADSSWARGHPEKIVDYGWRGIHATAVASKAIITAYYGTSAQRSYFIGCSKGGGSAIMEAQRFPTDYNGIIAGAPGWNHSGLFAATVWDEQTLTTNPKSWVAPAQLAVLHQAVLAACRGTNGVLDDPASCQFDAARLQCKGAPTSNCLTEQQVATVRKIYSGPLDANGRVLYAGLPRGSEIAWSRLMMGSETDPGVGTLLYNHATGYLHSFLTRGVEMDLHTVSASDAMSVAREQVGAALDATDPDLSAFKAAGGKLIHYHGWTDGAVPPGGSIQYYDSVLAKMGGVAGVQSFYRLFMAPGMDHCAGGEGPNAVGGPSNLPAPSHDPKYDIVTALEQWVEQGRTPDSIVATRYRDNDPTKEIVAQRPWCPYPQVARYTGRGATPQASLYVCAAPRK